MFSCFCARPSDCLRFSILLVSCSTSCPFWVAWSRRIATCGFELIVPDAGVLALVVGEFRRVSHELFRKDDIVGRRAGDLRRQSRDGRQSR